MRGQSHSAEYVSCIAVEQGHGHSDGLRYEAGLTPTIVSDAQYRIDFERSFTTSPLLFTTSNTQSGPNPFYIRAWELTKSGVRIHVEEEVSKDREVEHKSEEIAYFALQSLGPIQVLPGLYGAPKDAVGRRPFAIIADDVNGDNIQDLITANFSAASISVVLGNGEGSVAPERRFNVGYAPHSVASGDVDNDGYTDILVANSHSDDVSLLMGDGHGLIWPEERIAVGERPSSAILGDVNNDGWLDVLTANTFSHDVSVLLGNGDGTFKKDTRIPTGQNPLSVVLGDLNGDQWLDAVTANVLSHDVTVLMGRGRGLFERQLSFAVGSHPTSVALGDINNDKTKDIVVVNESSSNISILLGKGNGDFDEQTNIKVGRYPRSVNVADVNKDANLDIILTTQSASGGSILVLLGQGNGSFEDEERFYAKEHIRALTLTDMNRDDILDVVFANDRDDRIAVLLGIGNGRFEAALPKDMAHQEFAMGSGTLPEFVALGDVDDDGWIDVVTANAGSSSVSIRWGVRKGFAWRTYAYKGGKKAHIGGPRRSRSR